MASTEPNLTQEEIWDDSALVNSWNDALKEYKKYHSIHSKGGNVEDVINPNKVGEGSDAKRRDEPAEDWNAKVDDVDAQTEGVQESENVADQHSQLPVAGAAFVPAPLLGSVRDESLKKLLMSWYYAGYYTGFYEGQQAQQ
ncbi:hypothetical protein BKA67DRAFT_655061 [Truncatella angustata]|uniref:Survival Motor Neuron Gemin2-binding domain-containing protein n=1 Tax=Truncatella angustata TaxID=152316 RepID=A0A9P9A179_9PEZI|nr:uncharacterized protein BKA67DRAFT_655061 [Truncatella angustata]KAH6656750.1 hypothetical protein BKA67DRAFT_655061 [Truncatella angustata]